MGKFIFNIILISTFSTITVTAAGEESLKNTATTSGHDQLVLTDVEQLNAIWGEVKKNAKIIFKTENMDSCREMEKIIEKLINGCKDRKNDVVCRKWWHLYRDELANSYVDSDFKVIKIPNYVQYFKNILNLVESCDIYSFKGIEKFRQIAGENAVWDDGSNNDDENREAANVKLYYNDVFITGHGESRLTLYHAAVSAFGIVAHTVNSKGIIVFTENEYERKYLHNNIWYTKEIACENNLSPSDVQTILDNLDSGHFGPGNYDLMSNNCISFARMLISELCGTDADHQLQFLIPDPRVLEAYIAHLKKRDAFVESNKKRLNLQ